MRTKTLCFMTILILSICITEKVEGNLKNAGKKFLEWIIGLFKKTPGNGYERIDDVIEDVVKPGIKRTQSAPGRLNDAAKDVVPKPKPGIKRTQSATSLSSKSGNEPMDFDEIQSFDSTPNLVNNHF